MSMRPATQLLARGATVIALVSAGLAASPAAYGSGVTPGSGTTSSGPTGSGSNGPAQAVIVDADSVAAAARAVQARGGTVDRALPIVNGVAAHVSPAGIAALEANTALVVVPDATVKPTGASFRPGPARSGSSSAPAVDTQISAIDPPPGWSPDAGRGVTVALVDTGVMSSPDLQGDRLVRGPDLSGEGDGIDHYGHGTFMAGLIAGDGSASANGAPRHFGVAPGARIVSVKVAGADGSTTVSTVIAGIGWVVSHRDTYGIDVLNLSFGVEAPMPYFVNPLSAAAEAAWASGITVVVSAGNDGDGHVTSPGSDPYVITVGAADNRATPSTDDDVVPSWSGHERFDDYSKPDVVAPGVSVVSLRAPGSTIDVTHPEGRVGDVYFRGTGTSMSTAMVSGSAALLLASHPAATPDDVKGALIDGAARISAGAREVDLARADEADARADWWQHYPVAFHGLGRDFVDGMPWTASRWTSSRWTASRWTATRWTSTRWTEEEWAASRWTSSRWTSSRWTGTRWTSSRWTAEAWPSQSWG